VISVLYPMVTLMMYEIEGGQIPPLEMVLESDRRYFEENPEAEYGMRLPHPEEWPMVPAGMLDRMCVVVTRLAPDIRGRQLVELR
jgi:hypothetical protein